MSRALLTKKKKSTLTFNDTSEKRWNKMFGSAGARLRNGVLVFQPQSVCLLWFLTNWCEKSGRGGDVKRRKRERGCFFFKECGGSRNLMKARE